MQLAMKADVKPNYALIGRAVKMLRPDVVKEIEPRLLKPEASIIHTILLPALLKRFCELKEINEKYILNAQHDRDANEIKVLFIAVAIVLYDPAFLTGFHSANIRSNLAEELAGLLMPKSTLVSGRTWISQQTKDIKRMLNPVIKKQAQEAFRAEAYKLAKVLEIEFKK